jgi:hypothetical protein
MPHQGKSGVNKYGNHRGHLTSLNQNPGCPGNMFQNTYIEILAVQDVAPASVITPCFLNAKKVQFRSKKVFNHTVVLF